MNRAVGEPMTSILFLTRVQQLPLLCPGSILLSDFKLTTYRFRDQHTNLEAEGGAVTVELREDGGYASKR